MTPWQLIQLLIPFKLVHWNLVSDNFASYKKTHTQMNAHARAHTHTHTHTHTPFTYLAKHGILCSNKLLSKISDYLPVLVLQLSKVRKAGLHINTCWVALIRPLKCLNNLPSMASKIHKPNTLQYKRVAVYWSSWWAVHFQLFVAVPASKRMHFSSSLHDWLMWTNQGADDSYCPVSDWKCIVNWIFLFHVKQISICGFWQKHECQG